MKDVIKKWWFWLIILLMIIIIGFGILILIALLNIGNIENLSKDIKEIYNDATLYSSGDNCSLILEIHNFDNEKNKNEYSKIINKIKTSLSNGELEGYDELVEISYLNSKGKSEVLMVKTVYELPEFDLKDSTNYIKFDEYKSSVENLTNSNKSLMDILFK